jgi:hypothetical protein
MTTTQINAMRMVADAMVMPATMTAVEANLCRSARGASRRGGEFKTISGRRIRYTEILYIDAATYVWSDDDRLYHKA